MPSPLDQLLVTAGNDALSKADTLAKTVEDKKANLAKLSALNLPETAKNVVTGSVTGTGGRSMSPEEYDLRTMSNAQLVEKYGSAGLDAANREIGYAAGAHADQTKLQNNVGNIEAVKDFGVGIGSGAVNIGLGLAQLGALATPWSSEVAGFSKNVNEFMDSGLSNATLAERQMAQEQRALSDRDNQQQYAEEGDYSLLGKTSRELRNLGDRLGGFGEYGLTDANVVANAVGSIGGIGLATKAVAKTGGVVADKLLSEAGAKVAGKIGDAVRYPAMVGASEGGSAATDAMNQLMELPQAVIEKHPEYQKLKESNPNLTHTDIVKQLAEQAGLTAAAITAPVAGALSLLTKGFNDKKLLPTAPSLSGVAGNAAKETLEEVPQSITGTIATNTSIKEYGDTSRDTLKGTGQAAYDALIGSIGSTVGMQAPSGIKGSTLGAVEKVSNVVEASSPSNPTNIAAKSAQVATTVAPQATQAVEETVKAVETGAIPQQDVEKAKAHAEYTKKLTETFVFDAPNDVIDSVFESQPLRDSLYGTKTLPEAISRLANFVKRTDVTPAERMEASLSMVQFMRDAEDVLQAGDDVLNTHGSYAPLKQYQSTMANNVKALIDSNMMTEEVAKATEQLYKNALTSGYITEVTPENLSNPTTVAQESANLDKVVSVALASDKLPDELKGTVSTILQMVEAGSANLSPKQVKTLETLAALYNESEAMQQDAVELGATGTAFVNNQVLQNTTEERDISGRKMGNRLSLRGHVNGILTALNAGDTTAYQTRLKRFKAFVVEHNAKADAVDAHLAKIANGTLKNNERTPYSNTTSGKKGLFVNLNSQQSIANATAIQQEAIMLSRGYSRLLGSFGSEEDVKANSLPTKFRNRKVNPQLSGVAPTESLNVGQDNLGNAGNIDLGNVEDQNLGSSYEAYVNAMRGANPAPVPKGTPAPTSGINWDAQKKVLADIRAANTADEAAKILETNKGNLTQGNAARAAKLIEGKRKYAEQHNNNLNKQAAKQSEAQLPAGFGDVVQFEGTTYVVRGVGKNGKLLLTDSEGKNYDGKVDRNQVLLAKQLTPVMYNGYPFVYLPKTNVLIGRSGKASFKEDVRNQIIDLVRKAKSGNAAPKLVTPTPVITPVPVVTPTPTGVKGKVTPEEKPPENVSTSDEDSENNEVNKNKPKEVLPVNQVTIQMQGDNVLKINRGEKTTTTRSQSQADKIGIPVGESRISKIGDQFYKVTNTGLLTIGEAGGKDAILKSEGVTNESEFKYQQTRDWVNGKGKLFVYRIEPVNTNDVSENKNKPKEVVETLSPAQMISKALASPKGFKALLDIVDMNDEAQLTKVLEELVEQESVLKDQANFEKVTDTIINTLDKLAEFTTDSNSSNDFFNYMGNPSNAQKTVEPTPKSEVVEATPVNKVAPEVKKAPEVLSTPEPTTSSNTVEPEVKAKDLIKEAIGGNLAFGRDNAFYSGFVSKAKGKFALLGSNPLNSLKNLLGLSATKLKETYGSKDFAGLTDDLLMLYREVFDEHVPLLVEGFRNQLQEAIDKGNLTDAVGKAKGTGLNSIATIIASELGETDATKHSTAIRRAISLAVPSLDLTDKKAVKAFVNMLREYVNVSAEKTVLENAKKAILADIQAQQDEDILIQESLNKKAEGDESMRKVSEASLQGRRIRNAIWGEGLQEKLRLFEETHGKRMKEVGSSYLSYTTEGNDFMVNMKALRTALVDEFKKGTISKDTLVIRKELNNVADGKAFAFSNVTWSTDKNGNNNASLSVNQGLVETAAIGALQWLIHKSAIGKHEGLDKGEIAKIMNISEDAVTPELVSNYNNKHSVADMISDMVRFMQNALEVKEQSGNNYIGDTQGTLNALASTFLDVMANDPAFEVTVHDLSTEGVDTTLIMADLSFGVVITEDKYKRALRESVFKGFTDILNPLLGNPTSDNVFIGSTEGMPVAKTLLRSDVSLTEEQVSVVEKANAVKFRIHEPMRKVFNAIGAYGLVQIAGSAEVDLDRVNVNTLATREGQNLQLTSAFEHMQNIFAKVADYAKGTNQEETDVGIYYPNVFVSTSRLMQQSPAAPQSSKPIRAVVSATIRDVDLTNAEQLKLFKIALAQGLGIKVHNMEYAKVEKELTKLLDKPEVVQVRRALKDIFNKGEASDRAIAKIQEGYNAIGSTLWGLSSVVEYLRYLEAEKEGKLGNFRTNAAIEADGMTNGTANALHIMLGYPLTEKDVINWIRTGYYVGSENTTANAERTKDSTDIYTAVSSAMQREYIDFKKVLKDELKLGITKKSFSDFATKVARRFLNSDLDRMYAFIEEYSPNVSIDREKGTISFKRNFSKQPVTVSVYGAQLNTMVNYILQDIMDNIYESISGHLDGTDTWNQERVNQFNERIQALSATTISSGMFGIHFGYRKKGGKLDFNPYVPKLDLKNLDTFRQFTMRGESNDFLQHNIKTLIATPFNQALNEVFGIGLMQSMNTVISATSIHAAIISAAFNYAIQNSTLESAKDMRKVSPSKFITGKQLREIIKDITTDFKGVYEGNNQNFLISDKEGRSDLAKGAVASSFGGKFSSYARFRSLVPVGVKGAPVLNIGNGDASMIQNFIAALQGNLDALYVYDGVEFAITDVLENSVAINQAVFKTWTNNNVPRQVHNSFKSIPELMRPEYVTPELLALIAFASSSQPETYKDLLENLKLLSTELGRMADVIDARQNVLKGYASSVHQMASVEAPYLNKGKKFTDSTPKGIADEINSAVNIKTQPVPTGDTEVTVENGNIMVKTYPHTKGKVTKGYSTKAPNQEVPDTARKPRVDPNAVEGELLSKEKPKVESTDKPKVTKTGDTSKKLLRNMNEFIADLDSVFPNQSRDDKRLIVLIKRLHELSKGMLKETQIVVANDQNEAIRIAHDTGLLNKDELENFSKNIMNAETRALYVFPANFIVVLQNKGDLSSVAHEIIHAATFAALKIAYGKNNTLDMRTREGKVVKQLEDLMTQFLSNEFRANLRAKDPLTAAMAGNAIDIIESYAKQGKTAEAVAEYMAYVLADKRLANAAKDTEGKYSIVKAAKLVIEFIKSILGIPKDAAYLNNMLESLEFHTLLLTGSDLRSRTIDDTTTLEQRSLRRPVKDLLNQAFARIDQLEEGVKKKNEQLVGVFNKLVEHASQDVDNLVKLGFYMDSEESQLYSIVSALAQANLIEDSKVLNQLTDLYQLAIRELTLQDFSDTVVNTIDDAIAAQDMYNVLVSSRGFKDSTSSFARFVGLLAASESMQKALSNLTLRKNKGDSNDAVDTLVNSLGDKITDLMLGSIKGTGSDVGANLIEKLLSIRSNHSTFDAVTNNKVTSEVTEFNRVAAKFIQDYAMRASAATMKSVSGFSQRNPIRALVEVVGASFGIMDKTASEALSTSLNSWAAKLKGYDPVKDLLSDLIGRTEDNASIYDLIKPVKTFVAKTRQAYKVEVPTKLLKAFKRKLSKSELHTMTRVLAKSGIYYIGNSRAMDVLLGKENMESVIDSAIHTLNQYYGKDELQYILAKSGQLAEFNMTGKAGDHLLRNAYAIASLLGSDNRRVIDFSTRQSKSIVRAINTLIGVGSYDYLSNSDLDTINNLINKERDGVSLLLSYLEGISYKDTDKILSSPEALYNHYFGYLNQTASDGSHLTVVSDTQEANMRAQGYTRIQDYKGDSRDTIQGSFGYYYRAASPMNTFSQGIIQNIESTVAGVSRANGFSTNNVVGIVVSDGVVKDITNGVYESTNEDLIPVYGTDGSIISYERTMDYTLVNKIPVEMDITKVLGTTRGRQVEEVAAEVWNAEIIATMNQDYEEAVDKSNYIDLLDKDAFEDDPVYKESVSIFSSNFKEMVQAMGSNSLYARKETVREVIGYRKASLTDPFTGRSRLPKEVQKSIKDITMFMFGKDAFNYIAYAENAVLEGVQLVKTVIAVKSIVVPIANILGNLIHLASISVNMVNALKRVPVFLAEVEQYHRNQKRIVDIEVELTTNPSQFVIKKLNAELRSIEASNKRMKIYPLIEAGELSGVNDAGNLDGELPFVSTTSGKFRQTVERWIDQTPEGVKVVGRQLFVAKNTALFKGLQKTVMYGDFIAKAILYYDLLDKGTPVTEVKARVQEEFVNYDKLAGRTRDALESFGLLWFYNFKLRSMKIALNMLRNNPLYALTLGLGVSEPFNMGTAFTDNALGLAIKGDLSYSIGVEMGLNGMGMNPYHTLVN